MTHRFFETGLRRRYVLGLLASLWVGLTPALQTLHSGEAETLQMHATQVHLQQQYQHWQAAEQGLLQRASQAGQQVYRPLTSLAQLHKI